MELTAIFVIAAIALALLIADRYLRINPLLAREGFVVNGQPQRCGVDLEPCPHPLKCINGICGTVQTVQLLDRNPLPVVPSPPSLNPGLTVE